MEEELVLVTSDPSTYCPDDPGYVHVEWGLESILHRGIGFPDTTPGLVSNLGPLALNYVLLDGGSGYFRLHAVQPSIASGELHRVPGDPHFAFRVSVAYQTKTHAAKLGQALAV